MDTMNQDTYSHSDRPYLPPEPEKGLGLWRWLVNMVALAILGVGAYMAYNWLVGDIARRRALAVHAVAPASAPAPADNAAPKAPASAPAVRPAPQAAPDATRGVVAPAVVGGSVNKCVVDGQVTYTNTPCPEGAQEAPPEAPAVTGMDANGVVGSTGVRVAATSSPPVPLGGGADPGQLTADCNFLSAEVTRLDYEFQQPLPPPVLDHIATRLVELRKHAAAAQCAVPPARSSAPTKVVEEKPVPEKPASSPKRRAQPKKEADDL